MNQHERVGGTTDSLQLELEQVSQQGGNMGAGGCEFPAAKQGRKQLQGFLNLSYLPLSMFLKFGYLAPLTSLVFNCCLVPLSPSWLHSTLHAHGKLGDATPFALRPNILHLAFLPTPC